MVEGKLNISLYALRKSGPVAAAEDIWHTAAAAAATTENQKTKNKKKIVERKLTKPLFRGKAIRVNMLFFHIQKSNYEQFVVVSVMSENRYLNDHQRHGKSEDNMMRRISFRINEYELERKYHRPLFDSVCELAPTDGQARLLARAHTHTTMIGSKFVLAVGTDTLSSKSISNAIDKMRGSSPFARIAVVAAAQYNQNNMIYVSYKFCK